MNRPHVYLGIGLVVLAILLSGCVSSRVEVEEKFNKRKAIQEMRAQLAGQPYPAIGAGHWISGTMDNGSYILLEDGSLWSLSSLDRIDTGLWLPKEEIIVIENPHGLFPYKLINNSQGDIVEATCVSLRN